MLLAYLTYGLAAGGQAAKTYLQKILVLQKRVLRFIKADVVDCSVSDHDIIFADLHLKAFRPKVTKCDYTASPKCLSKVTLLQNDS